MQKFSSRIRLTLAAVAALCAAAPSFAQLASDVNVVIHTSMGDIAARLDSRAAPLTVKNFLAYARSGFYNGTVFHRVINGFMIQGGGMTEDMAAKKTLPPIPNEARGGLTNKRGTLAMARTSDPHSATSQFFINLVDNDFLDAANAQDRWGYTVFGRVTKGMDVVDRISRVRTGYRRGHNDVPVTPVTILSVDVK
jgi:cyclophilin family peptidyl-prolyl cis-trans isomerase